MIDYEVKIFNEVHSVAAPLCAKNRFVSAPVLDFEKLPASSLWEMDNQTVRRAQSSTPIENRARITYQVRVAATDKATCKKIYGAIDEKMISLNFSKMSGTYMPNMTNTKVVEIVARYEAEVDRDGNLYRVG